MVGDRLGDERGGDAWEVRGGDARGAGGRECTGRLGVLG